MSTSGTLSTTVATSAVTPPQIFVGSERNSVATWYCIVYLFSIPLHVAFIMGARKLRGWRADFSFTLLLFLSTMALLYFVVHSIGTITALFYMDWLKYQILWIFLGSLAYGAIFTVTLIDLVITLHRLIYTIWPFTGNNYRNVLAAKVTTCVIGVYFVLFVIALNTELIGVRWIDSFMGFEAMRSRNLYLFDIINKISNYLTGIVNSVAYALLLIVLVRRKLLSFPRNHELKVTIQVSFMMVEEVGFFIYWEFFPLQGYGVGMDIVIAETTLMLFLDVLILPYLILNRNIHEELKHLYVRHIRNSWPTIRLRELSIRSLRINSV